MATNRTAQTDYLLGYAFVSIGIHLLTHDNIIANNVIILWSPILVIDLTTCYNVISALLHQLYYTVLWCAVLCLYHFKTLCCIYAMCLTYSFMATIIEFIKHFNDMTRAIFRTLKNRNPNAFNSRQCAVIAKWKFQ